MVAQYVGLRENPPRSSRVHRAILLHSSIHTLDRVFGSRVPVFPWACDGSGAHDNILAMDGSAAY